MPSSIEGVAGFEAGVERAVSLHAEDLVALVARPARADGPAAAAAVRVPDRDGPVTGELVVVCRGGWRSDEWRAEEPVAVKGGGGLRAVVGLKVRRRDVVPVEGGGEGE